MPPDTSAYYHVAYVWVAVVYVVYTISIGVRAKRARARLSAGVTDAASR